MTLMNGYSTSLYQLHSLALSLFCDVANGGPLLADYSPHILCWHQHSQGDVSVCVFWGHPRAGVATTGTAGPITRAPAVIMPPLTPLQVTAFVWDVGDVQGSVVNQISIQFLDSSEERNTNTKMFFLTKQKKKKMMKEKHLKQTRLKYWTKLFSEDKRQRYGQGHLLPGVFLGSISDVNHCSLTFRVH